MRSETETPRIAIITTTVPTTNANNPNTRAMEDGPGAIPPIVVPYNGGRPPEFDPDDNTPGPSPN
eukprot:CAMPEP_0168858642 /NCGR_PEP_ID=MMETSP0727-20121128/16395_1 /TAXON_ID=265536 /ORGANISM="Amphiprora sp., Strain CCMP467" /LENGTH=64 /DNA_ID=CAMNT_0008913397 /DNA_START=117 /DNA_END=311 /DNA_ORIENTATION=+